MAPSSGGGGCLIAPDTRGDRRPALAHAEAGELPRRRRESGHGRHRHACGVHGAFMIWALPTHACSQHVETDTRVGAAQFGRGRPARALRQMRRARAAHHGHTRAAGDGARTWETVLRVTLSEQARDLPHLAAGWRGRLGPEVDARLIGERQDRLDLGRDEPPIMLVVGQRDVLARGQRVNDGFDQVS